MKKLTVEDTSRTKGGMKIKSGLKAGPLIGTISVKVPGLNSINLPNILGKIGGLGDALR